MEGYHQRHAVLVQQRNNALGVGCAARHEQCQHTLVLDERAGVVLRQLGVELFVERDEFDLLPVHAAAGVTSSRYSDAPSIDSLTVAAADPVMPTV